jgi:hypothetical protein
MTYLSSAKGGNDTLENKKPHAGFLYLLTLILGSGGWI